MTCIVGLETKTGVIIGCDSACVAGQSIDRTRLRKVFRRGEFLIGYTTSFRMGQLLQYKLDVEPQGDDQSDLEYLATVFIDAARRCLRDGGSMRIKDGQEEGGEFLVGYKQRLYVIDSDFQVGSSREGFAVVGAGGNLALGSLWATQGKKPGKRVRMALKAAARFNSSVCGPYRVLELETI